jgi:hypothetical protein
VQNFKIGPNSREILGAYHVVIFDIGLFKFDYFSRCIDLNKSVLKQFLKFTFFEMLK